MGCFILTNNIDNHIFYGSDLGEHVEENINKRKTPLEHTITLNSPTTKQLERATDLSDLINFKGRITNTFIPDSFKLSSPLDIKNCAFTSCSNAMFSTILNQLTVPNCPLCFEETILPTIRQKPNWYEVKRTLDLFKLEYKTIFFQLVQEVFEKNVIFTDHYFLDLFKSSFPGIKSVEVFEQTMKERNINYPPTKFHLMADFKEGEE